jgi:hypothetical protein
MYQEKSGNPGENNESGSFAIILALLFNARTFAILSCFLSGSFFCTKNAVL